MMAGTPSHRQTGKTTGREKPIEYILEYVILTHGAVTGRKRKKY